MSVVLIIIACSWLIILSTGPENQVLFCRKHPTPPHPWNAIHNTHEVNRDTCQHMNKNGHRPSTSLLFIHTHTNTLSTICLSENKNKFGKQKKMPNLESYPPVFRRKHNDFDPDESVQDFQECYHSDPVPSLDLGSLNLEKLGDACRNWGLFRLVSHGIPETLMSQLRSQANNLFSFSFETKQRLFTNKPAAVSIYFWGTPALTPSGAALARAPQSINWVEGFNVPLTQLSDRNQYFQGQQDPLFDSFRYSFHFINFFLSFLVSSFASRGYFTFIYLDCFFLFALFFGQQLTMIVWSMIIIS